MKYLMIAAQTEDKRYQGLMPDFPGLSMSADTLDALAAEAQPMVEDWMRKKKPEEFPQPGALDSAREAEKPGRICMLVDIDTAFINMAKVRVNISVPSYALYIIDKAARKAGLNRSEYLVRKALA